MKETARLETFADGVFAIAITLLVLEIHLPGPGEDLGKALLAQWPSFAAYVTSFLGIGVMWVSHHQMFTIIHKVTPTFLFLNVLLLLPVAFTPYATALLAQHVLEPEGRTIAVLVYGLTSVLIATMFNVLWIYATRHGLVMGGVAISGFRLGPLVYLAATGVAIVSPIVGLLMFAALAGYWMLPGRIPSA